MTTFTLSRDSTATAEALFAVATDVERLPTVLPAVTRVERLTPGPLGVGSRIAETRKVFGRESTETFEITAWEPGRRFQMTAHTCGCEFVADHRFLPTPTGCTIELEVHTRPVTWLARLTAPLGKLMAGTMKKMIADDLKHLAEAAERPSA